MEKITYNNTLVAVHIKDFKDGITPLSDSDQSLQILVHKREKGSHTKAHLHKPTKRETNNLQECLVVLKGKIKIDFYDSNKNVFKTIFIGPHEVVIFMSGGHSVDVDENCEFIEVKNGPFIEDREFLE